jgi:hypothetical protein
VNFLIRIFVYGLWSSICMNATAQDIVIPKNIRDFKFDNSVDEKIKCSYISIYPQERETNEIYTFYINEPSSMYSSIKEIQLKGTRLSVSFIQKVELMQYQSNIIVKEYQIDPSKVEDLEKEQQCVKALGSRKELNVKKIKSTGRTKWFDQARAERILIVGFDKVIQVGVDDPGWKSPGELELDLRPHIRSSTRAGQVMSLSVRCVSCSSKRSELPDGIPSPRIDGDIRADFRFIKNQMDRGLIE